MSFHDLLRERVEKEGPKVALKWGEDLRKGRQELREKQERERKEKEAPPYAHN